MGGRGPAPIPTKIKLVNGNPGRRRLNRHEPEPTIRDAVPGPPAFLDDVAAAEWDRVAPELHSLGLLSVVDESALAVYCRAVATHRKAEDWLGANSLTVVNATGSIVADPHVAIARGAATIIKGFAAEFGFTPAARSRIQVPDKKKPSEGKARFFGGTG